MKQRWRICWIYSLRASKPVKVMGSYLEAVNYQARLYYRLNCHVGNES
jgi:hypothetical protein